MRLETNSSRPFSSILFLFEKNTEKKQTVVNCIKILMRCSKITEAIVFVRKIIKMIITREKLMMEAIDSDSKERTFENYNRLLDLTIRIFKMIERL